MSILIKGMDMPKACNKCPFHNAYICTAKGSPVSLQIYLYDKKPLDCPLVEIPTHHGRLIDADKLAKVIEDAMNRKDNPLGVVINYILDNRGKRLKEVGRCPNIRS